MRLFSKLTRLNNRYFRLRWISDVPYTAQLNFKHPSATPRPGFQIVNEEGIINGKLEIPDDIDTELCHKLYKSMVTLQTLDKILSEVQRQGRIGFYLTATGEEGIMIGSSSALQPQDVIFGQYREQGVYLYRGLSIQEMMDQCFSTIDDVTKGRQMPIHYGSKRLNIHTISSPLATQIPQATGAAYALKLEKNNDAIVICYFGEGAASEGDFHAGLNFAATLECPVVFFCRNNGYAISTSSREQYAGDGIVCRAEGYGMASIRVDGNDVFAVREATLKARQFAVMNNKPVLIEAISYRMGHHSTSDDSSHYRRKEEVEKWAKRDPVERLKLFMKSKEIWTDDDDKEHKIQTRAEILNCIKLAEAKPKPNAVENLFDDVYDKLTPNLKQQKQDLLKHLQKYPKHYDIL